MARVGMGVVPGMERSPRLNLYLGLLLTAVTVAVFGQVLGHQFIVYDDGAYVTDNCHVRTGPSLANLIWAFTTFRSGNWHPITWISHMFDSRLFALNPMGHHLTSLLIHLANVLLLFALLNRMTSSPWRSGFVAMLFAIHPLHVESVAWVAERKDVLSTLFGLLALHAYVRYAELKPKSARQRGVAYSLTILAFTLGLMSKPMVVTLPFIMLLLDYWPLGRVKAKQQSRNGLSLNTILQRACDNLFLFFEKIPLFALSALSSLVTYYAQQSQGAVGRWGELPLAYRIGNALLSYQGYVWKTLWPQNLAVFYPHPGNGFPLWQPLLGGAMLLMITVLVLKSAWPPRSRPYLIVGWLWYLGTLVPVIGIVQVGSQAMADRYTYVPLVGLFMMATWGIGDLVKTKGAGAVASPQVRGRRRVASSSQLGLALAAFVAVVGLAACASVQTAYWKDSVSLFEHALRVTIPNPVAHNCLGSALEAANKLDDAKAHFIRALEIRPRYAEAHYHLGVVLHRQGLLDEAMRHYEQAAEINPNIAEAYINMGVICLKQRRLEQAICHYCHAIRINPEEARAYQNLAVALYVKGDYTGAWRQVCRCRQLGGKVHPHLVQALAAKIPEVAQ